MPSPVGVNVISMSASVGVALTVPFNQHADRGIDFCVAAGDHRPVEVKVERVPPPRSRHEISSALSRPAHVQEAQAVRVGKMSSQNASPEQPTGRNQVSGTLKWQRVRKRIVLTQLLYPKAVSRPRRWR